MFIEAKSEALRAVNAFEKFSAARDAKDVGKLLRWIEEAMKSGK